MVNDLLSNPVFNALSSVDASFNQGSDTAKFFDKQVSPFAGFDASNANGFEELYELLPTGRKILYANPLGVEIPVYWSLLAHVPGLQFVLQEQQPQPMDSYEIVPLNEQHIDEMIQLTKLTRPGPFGKRTIEFGNYVGIFGAGKLLAMAGQRLHLPGYSEISAVCTHPDHLGKGYAAALLHHKINFIAANGKTAFLHVRADNTRATDLYKRLGFAVTRPMHFYFLQKL